MKKKSILKCFFVNLFKSLFIIALILGVGVGSYMISYRILSKDIHPQDTAKDVIEDIIDQATTDKISRNLIFVCDGTGTSKKITHMMLEICNTETNNMDYVTIPVNTKYVIPTSMYRKLCVIAPNVPQYAYVSKLRKYFKDLSDEDAFGYSELIVEKMIGLDISYYTVISEEDYKAAYQETTVKCSYQKVAKASQYKKDGKNNYSYSGTISVLNDAQKEEYKQLAESQSDIADYIKEQYKTICSNLTVYNKIGYMECYKKLNVDCFHYWGIPGIYDGKVFSVDKISSKCFLKNLMDNTESYTEVQTFEKAKKITANSKNLTIEVFNGCQVTGLATSTQKRLIDMGYLVTKIGDDANRQHTRTQIIVTKKGMGEDLAAYFVNPQIIVGQVEPGFDIKIIVGSDDSGY